MFTSVAACACVCFHSERAIKVYIHRVSRYANGTHHTASTEPTGLSALRVRSALQVNRNVENDVDADEWFRLRGGREKTPIANSIVCIGLVRDAVFPVTCRVSIVHRVFDLRKTKTDICLFITRPLLTDVNSSVAVSKSVWKNDSSMETRCEMYMKIETNSTFTDQNQISGQCALRIANVISDSVRSL